MPRVVWFAPLVWVMSVQTAYADLAAGREKLTHGDYKEALSTLEAASGRERFDAQLLKVQALVRVGELTKAERLAKKLASASGERGIRGQIAYAEVLSQTGRYDQAKHLLEPIVAKHMSDHMRARYLLALLYRNIGQYDRSEKMFLTIDAQYRDRSLDEKSAEQLFYLAQAGRYLESFEFAKSFFTDALALDPAYHEANIAFRHLFLYKYNAADAEQSFDEVLKIDPNHPDAHAGLARVKLEQSYDLAAATYHLERALEVNPKHIPSLEIRAELETDKNQWSAAIATIGEILKINPNHAGARSQLATIHWLRDETPAYEAEKAKVFAINPKYAPFYHIVARSAVREHRYKEAIELENEALQLDPSYYLAMAEVGTGYLRLGNESKGLEWLRKAYKKDGYNVRTVNLLDLFEQVIPKDYETATSKSFRFRLHKDERVMFERYVPPVLERAFADMSKRYGFKPSTVILELYRDPAHYSVRTVGLPNLGALGVCFGQVITARSALAGDINWGMVLWHELSHVFAIQLSNSRVPRWYTEGLSEYETMVARPEWRRENDADLYSAMLEDAIPSVAELNYGFMKPDMSQIVVAYYLSAVTIEYIVDTYGFDRVVEGLRLFGTGLETPEVISKITGKTVAAFDKEFRSYLEKRLAPYKGTFRLPASGFSNVDALKEAAKKAGNKARPWAELALGHFFDGDADNAKKAVDKALASDPHEPIALYIRAELALRSRKIDEARAAYEAMIKSGSDGGEIRGRLGMIAAHEKNNVEAEKQFCAAKRLDPERSYPYQALADLYFEQNKPDAALAELETYVSIEQMQYEPIKKLVDELFTRSRWAKVRYYGEMAMFINPGDSDLLLKLGRAYAETGSAAEALYSYDSALLATPALRRPALAHIGRASALEALGQHKNAQRAAKMALKLEPNNADALAVASKLGVR